MPSQRKGETREEYLARQREAQKKYDTSEKGKISRRRNSKLYHIRHIEEHKEYMAEYIKRPEVQERAKERRRTQESRNYQKAYREKHIEKFREQARCRNREAAKTEKVLEIMRAISGQSMTSEEIEDRRQKKREYYREYRQRPEVKAKRRVRKT